MSHIKRIAEIAPECVACGCCEKVCRKNAIVIHKGLRAVSVSHNCVGCGQCVKTCPADVIKLREVKSLEKALV